MLKRAWLRRCLLRQRTREPRPPTGRMLNPCAALPLLYARTVRWPGSIREALRCMLRAASTAFQHPRSSVTALLDACTR